MDQAIERASMTVDEIAADVARDGLTFLERGGKPGFVALPVREYVRFEPVSTWLEGIWEASVARGLDKTTMDEIDIAIEEVRREQRESAARS